MNWSKETKFPKSYQIFTELKWPILSMQLGQVEKSVYQFYLFFFYGLKPSAWSWTNVWCLFWPLLKRTAKAESQTYIHHGTKLNVLITTSAGGNCFPLEERNPAMKSLSDNFCAFPFLSMCMIILACSFFRCEIIALHDLLLSLRPTKWHKYLNALALFPFKPPTFKIECIA